MSLRPEYFLTGLFGMMGLVLLLLSDPTISGAMALQPATVPLDDEGYKLIAQTMDTDAAVTYMGRVANTIKGKVLDEDKMREFAAFSAFEGVAVADGYADLKKQLYNARKGGNFKDPFLTVDEKPLNKGDLVQRNGQKGEVVKCLNPQQVLEWRYEVLLGDETKEICADELEVRSDMRWMSKDAVLAIIPDSLEDSLMGYAEMFQGLTAKLKGVEQPLRDIAGWKDKNKSAMVSIGLLAAAVVFIWIQRAFFVIVVSFLFATNTEVYSSFSRRRAGKAAFEKRKRESESRSFREWGFYTEAEEAPVDTTKSHTQSLKEMAHNMFHFKK